MAHNILKRLERQLERNAQLLTLADEEEWESFINELEQYARQLQTLNSTDLSQFEDSLKEVAVEQMAILLRQDRLLMQAVKTRMEQLSSEMSAMRKSRHSARAYIAV